MHTVHAGFEDVGFCSCEKPVSLGRRGGLVVGKRKKRGVLGSEWAYGKIFRWRG